MPRKMKKKSDSEQITSTSSAHDLFDTNAENDESFDIKINESFAKKFEEKKRLEELNKLKQTYGDIPTSKLLKINSRNDDDASDYSDNDDDSEYEEEEDSDGELITPELDAQIMKTIGMIREKKEEVYTSDKKFFDDEALEEAKKKWEEKQKIKASEKPVTLKDLHREKLLKKMNGEISMEDDGDDDEIPIPAGPSFVEEQQKLKEDFKAAAFEDDDDDLFTTGNDDFLKLRPKTEEDIKAEEEEYRNFLLGEMKKEGIEGLSNWKEYSDNTKMDPNDKFLMDYVLTKGWVEKSKDKAPTYEELVKIHHDDSDEEAVEAADEFERKHNFRFQESGGDKIATYARNIEGSLRRPDDKRKKQREKLKERKSEEKLKQAEELKRLKNLKKMEILEQLKRIQEISGTAGGEGDDAEGNSEKVLQVGFHEILLDDEFDPEKYDKKMNELFGNQYYDSTDPAVKPEFDDDIDITDIVGNQEDEEYLQNEDESAQLERVRKADTWDEYDEGAEYDGEYGGEEYYEEEGYQQNEADPAAGNEEDIMMDADYLPGGEKYGQVPTKKKKEKLDKKAKKAKLAGLPFTETTTTTTSTNDKKKLTFSEYLEKYYQLDYEDIVGGQPTRFQYRQVPGDTYGLTPTEILLATDQELNELMSLKQMAPYRRSDLVEKDKKRRKTNVWKMKLREIRRNIEKRQEEEERRAKRKAMKKMKKEHGEDVEEEVSSEKKVESGEESLKKKKKRKALDEEELKKEETQEGEKSKKTKIKKEAEESDDAGSKKKKEGKKSKKEAGISESRLKSYQMPKKR